MNRNAWLVVSGWLLTVAGGAWAQVPDTIVAEGVPEVPPALRSEVSRYLEFRTAVFQDWHPVERRMLITTRFADAAQLHVVGMPGGARRQLTFLGEPVNAGSYQPVSGRCLVFLQDSGGGEFYQIYRLDVAEGRITLLTDGKSRNGGAVWSKDGKWLAYSTTKRNGKDTDVHVMDPWAPEADRCVWQVTGGGWSAVDWSEDGKWLLVREAVSINESYLHVVEVGTGKSRLLTPRGGEKVAYGAARFEGKGSTVLATSDRGAEFQRLVRMDVGTGREVPLGVGAKGDVEDFELSPDGREVALVVNEEGLSVLRVVQLKSGKERRLPAMASGVMSGLKWHSSGRWLGFTVSGARSSGDAYAVDLKEGKVERWTESETGGLDAARFVEPELVRVKSFDGLAMSGFLYRPDPVKFPGRRPVLVSIHGGPESQVRPQFQARNNFYLNELGVALLCPNVRGSSGYGKTFVALDNGFKREDSVKDIGAFLDWIAGDARLDAGRVGVMGGSYGGYMVLASLIHHGPRLRCGVDVVGISNFLTFLQNTQDYRRDLRRVEYGDERDPAMKEFLAKISPTASVDKIRSPLLVVQGKNDPRVPVTESEQMVKALRDRGGAVWYVMARDEGHGFAKKKNADYQFQATVLFLKEHLLGK